jgi:hypothetical protein
MRTAGIVLTLLFATATASAQATFELTGAPDAAIRTVVWTVPGSPPPLQRPALTPEYRLPDPRILVYGNDGVWRPAVEPIDSAAGQIDPVSADPMAGVGPAVAFARRLVEQQPRRRVILVPCAKGGTSIDVWARADARTTLYGSCLARVRETAARGRLAGLLWYQGESDARDATSAGSWSAKFTRVVEDFRSDLRDPDLRVLVVGLADPPLTGVNASRFPAWRAVQDAQRDLRLPNSVHVSAAQLPMKADQLHLTTAGQIALGQRMADAWEARR